MAISDKADFLTKYSEAFGMNYEEVSLAESSEAGAVYALINSSKEIVGKAQFVTDEQGRVSAINFTR